MADLVLLAMGVGVSLAGGRGCRDGCGWVAHGRINHFLSFKQEKRGCDL
ncbi:hypothetical protein E2C01_094723 [Portunus trituberculatus]|uniref:Uncharacterized protein n=1 Tax=Portunus trituberculatus TaxID=210409 RepID=A0A5B7K1M0_PORTR|nr:hypothetical protein [Portunus trituberculatus]